MPDATEVTEQQLSAWLLERVPAIRSTYDEVKTWTDPDSGSYAMLSFVLKPHIEHLVAESDETELQRIFDLLEYLANHGDGADPPVSGSVKNELGVMMEEMDISIIWKYLGRTLRSDEFDRITWYPSKKDRETTINDHVDRERYRQRWREEIEKIGGYEHLVSHHQGRIWRLLSFEFEIQYGDLAVSGESEAAVP
jgi:hypothetical protein